MSDNELTDNELTAQWIAHVYCNGLHDMGRLDCDENEGKFYAWLAEHDRQVKAEAWDEGWHRGLEDAWQYASHKNPYREAVTE